MSNAQTSNSFVSNGNLLDQSITETTAIAELTHLATASVQTAGNY